MTKQLLAAVFLSLLAVLLFAPTSLAQTSNPCVVTEMWTSWPYVTLPPGWFYTGNIYNWGVPEIAIYLASCTPQPCPCSATGGGTPGPGGSGSGGGSGGSGSGTGGSAGGPALGAATGPTSMATGNTAIAQQDISVPGLGGGLHLTRTWNSQWPSLLAAYSVGIFGPNWRSTYEEKIFMGPDNYLKYGRSDGTFWSFGLGPNGTLVPATPARVSATLSQNSTNWILVFQNGEQRQFSVATGLLTAIIDRNGNTTQLTYNSSNQLVTVTSAASQHLYFNYGSGSQNLLVTSVTSDFGVTFSYSYDSNGRLLQVTKPDSTTVSFTYNSQSQITSVTDNNGLVLESHTYDSSGRGLTSSLANGVNAFTATYPQ